MVKLQLLLVSLLSGVATAQWGGGRPTGRWPTQQQPPAPTQQQPTVVSPPRPGDTQSLYGQCGGQNWTGPTACPTGAYCKNDGNIWYSQCVANEAPGGNGNPSASGPGVTIRTLTTVFSVGGPTPTVVSTKITYLSPRPTTTTQQPSVVTVTLVPDDPCDHEVWC